jgi:hypothetical protein
MVDTVQPQALASFRNRSALSLLMKMQLLRSSKAKPETKGQDTRLERPSYLKGLDAANHHRASGGGRRVFLTSPLIEQGVTLRIPAPGILRALGMLRQPSGDARFSIPRKGCF